MIARRSAWLRPGSCVCGPGGGAAELPVVEATVVVWVSLAPCRSPPAPRVVVVVVEGPPSTGPIALESGVEGDADELALPGVAAPPAAPFPPPQAKVARGNATTAADSRGASEVRMRPRYPSRPSPRSTCRAAVARAALDGPPRAWFA